MPRTMKSVVIDTSLAESTAVPAQQLPPANLDQPDMVACIRCGEPSPAVDREETGQRAAKKCPGCGLSFGDEIQDTRFNVARKQAMAAGERAQREHVIRSRAVDPNQATNVVQAFEKVLSDIQKERDAAAVEVEASAARYEKACAAVFALEDAESREARDKARGETTDAPKMLERWEDALARAQSLRALAEEADTLVAANPSAQAFQAELANRMAAASKLFAAAFAEVAAAFEAQSQHASVMRASGNKRKELNEQLMGIKRSLSLTRYLPQGFGRFASHEEVSSAVVQVIVKALNASGIHPNIVDDIRARIRWQ